MCVWVYFWNFFSLVKFFSFICCTKTKIVGKNHGETFSKKIIISRLPFFISFLSYFLICKLLHFPSCVTRNSKTSQTKNVFLASPPRWWSFYISECHFISMSKFISFYSLWNSFWIDREQEPSTTKKNKCVLCIIVCVTCVNFFLPIRQQTN